MGNTIQTDVDSKSYKLEIISPTNIRFRLYQQTSLDGNTYMFFKPLDKSAVEVNRISVHFTSNIEIYKIESLSLNNLKNVRIESGSVLETESHQERGLQIRIRFNKEREIIQAVCVMSTADLHRTRDAYTTSTQ